MPTAAARRRPSQLLDAPRAPSPPPTPPPPPPQLLMASATSGVVRAAPLLVSPPRPLPVTCGVVAAGVAGSHMKLLSLPDDVLSVVVAHVLQPLRLSGAPRIVEHAYRRALPLAATCRRMGRLVDVALGNLELWQTARISSLCVGGLARRVAKRMRRLVLRGCTHAVNAAALAAVAAHCPSLRVLDVSHTPVAANDLAKLLATLPELRECRIRSCHALDAAGCHKVLSTLGRRCAHLETLDAGHLPELGDAALRGLLQGAGAACLRTLCVSRCAQLGDEALRLLAAKARGLRSLTARGLPRISNAGILELCAALGAALCTLDVLDCDRLHADAYLDAVRTHCPRIAWRLRATRGRNLRQVVISALAGNIFYVTGSDICNGKAAVYFLLVDAGTADSFRVSIGSSSLDLTNFGSILASCFGDKPSQQVKDTMLLNYGLDLANEDDEALVPIRDVQ